MPSIAVFVCYVCHHVFTLSLKHFCQPECNFKLAMHYDLCHRCIKLLEAQLAPAVNDASLRRE